MNEAVPEVKSLVGLADYLENQIPPKVDSGDVLGRMRDVVSDPLNALITRHPWAGQVLYDDVVLHNGNIVPYIGPLSYYGSQSQVLIVNRGVHEPLEEYCFQEMLKCLPDEPVMLELGAYWGHYSMWCQKVHPKAQLFLVEPEMPNLECAINNFKRNGFSGIMMQDFVGDGHFQVDEYVERKQLPKLHILHSDIQGYEGQMLRGGQNSLASRKVDYVFVSTHSDEPHEECMGTLKSYGYEVTVQSNFSTGTTSYDGIVLACSPEVKPLLKGFKFLERLDILRDAGKR
jgi:hypothetical protein